MTSSVAFLSDLNSPRRLLESTAEPYGDSVRLRKLKPGDPRPPHLYLIYVTLDGNGLVVRHVEKDIDPALLDQEEDNLIRDAMTSTNLVGANFDRLDFTGPTNLTIVLDEDGWEFYYPDPHDPEPPYPETHDPIVFIRQKSFIAEDGTVTLSVPASRNRSFYDLEPATKRINGLDRKSIRFINHFRKNENGDTFEPEERLYYSFNLFLRVPFSNTAAQKKITVIIDPDGQNQGPPANPLEGEQIDRQPVLEAESA